MEIAVAAVDTGKTGEQQVPWLFSNDSTDKIGALFSSRKGTITCEDPVLENCVVQMVKGQSGHWLLPIVDFFIELATPTGQASPIANFQTSVPNVEQVSLEGNRPG